MISPIVQASDAISGSRPGARREIMDSYVKRLKELEELALNFDGSTNASPCRQVESYGSWSMQTM